MEQKIVDAIILKYNPVGIILYGSRSTDVALEHSDWDIVCITNSHSGSDSFSIDGEDVDLDIIKLPIDTQTILEHFDGTLQTAKILFDTNNQARTLLDGVLAEYSKGRNLSDEKLNLRRQFLKRRFKKLTQSQDDKILYTIHIGVFIEKATQAWYEILNNRWRTSLRSRLIAIKQEDPEFYLLLEQLTNNDMEVSLASAKQILSKII